MGGAPKRSALGSGLRGQERVTRNTYKHFLLFHIMRVQFRFFTQARSCGQCVFSFYEPHEDHTSSMRFNKCRLFGEIVNGRVLHDYAETCRIQETKCGNKGRFFKRNDNP